MIRIRRKCKKPKWVVTHNIQGQAHYYLYKTMIGAFIGYAKVYKRCHKYGTSNVELREWTVVAFWNTELRNEVENDG